MAQTRRKSTSAMAEERMIAAEIAKSNEFTACLHLGPGNRQTATGMTTYEEALEAKAQLDAGSRFGRKAIIYAVTKLGSFPCDDELIALARSL